MGNPPIINDCFLQHLHLCPFIGHFRARSLRLISGDLVSSGVSMAKVHLPMGQRLQVKALGFILALLGWIWTYLKPLFQNHHWYFWDIYICQYTSYIFETASHIRQHIEHMASENRAEEYIMTYEDHILWWSYTDPYGSKYLLRKWDWGIIY